MDTDHSEAAMLPPHADLKVLLAENARLRRILGEIVKTSPESVNLEVQPDGIGRKFTLELQYQGTTALSGKEEIEEVECSSWICVLQFPNPDHPNCEQRVVSLEEALRIFKSSFLGEDATDNYVRKRNFQEEFDAFRNLFLQLDDLQEGKKLSHGGKLQPLEGGGFTDTGEAAKDFLTLIRNVVMVKLTQHLCLNARQVLSSNSEDIYILVYADEADLISEAERVEFNTQLFVYCTDMASLEPCDDRLRPLRVLVKDKTVSDLIYEIDDLYSQLFPKHHYPFDMSTLYKPAGVQEGHWLAFISYLKEMKKAVQDLCGIPDISQYDKFCYLGKKSLRTMELINAQNPKFKLRNLWDRLNLPRPVGAYSDFCRNFNTDGEDEFLHLWRTHGTNTPGVRSLFRNYEQLKLINSLINRQVFLHSLQANHLLRDHFPLHDNQELTGSNVIGNKAIDQLLSSVQRRPKQPLVVSWHQRHFFDTSLPINSIKNYFGEKVALYFSFTSHLCNALIPVAIFGLPLFILQRVLDYTNTGLIVLNAIYCVFIAFWATILLEIWRRKEATHAFAWGTTDYLQDEVPRPQFHGSSRRSPVTDALEETHFSEIRRALHIAFGLLVSAIVLLMVIGIVAGLIIMRWELTSALMVNGFDGAGPLTSVLNAIQIQIFNFLYEILAFKLTDFENHHTQSSYEKSFIVKSYLFQFVNSYNALIYIAFIKSYTEGCIVKDATGKKVKEVGANCMDELYTQLTSLFLVAYVRNIIELGLPYLKNRRRLAAFRQIQFTESQADQTCKRVEDNLMRSTYANRSIDGTYADMLEVSISFGYLTIFAVGFPLGGLLAYIGLLLELQVDRYKLLKLMRRPQPEGVSDIGIWWDVFQITIIVSIFTNAGLFCFTAHTFDGWLNDWQQFIPFVLIVVGLLGARSWLQQMIPDVPAELLVVGRRHDEIRGRFLSSWEPAKKDPAKMKEALNFTVLLPSTAS